MLFLAFPPLIAYVYLSVLFPARAIIFRIIELVVLPKRFGFEMSVIMDDTVGIGNKLKHYFHLRYLPAIKMFVRNNNFGKALGKAAGEHVSLVLIALYGIADFVIRILYFGIACAVALSDKLFNIYRPAVECYRKLVLYLISEVHVF